MKRLVIGLLAIMMVLGAALEYELYSWIVVSGPIILLLPTCYLVSPISRDYIDRLLKVQNPTSAKRWIGGLLVFYMGAALLVNGYLELQKQYQEREKRELAQVEVQTLLESAKASIKTKDIEKALTFLRTAVSIDIASNKDEAWDLLRRVNAAVSYDMVRQVLFQMTDHEFVAFKRDGQVPNKVYLSDPNLNEVFIEVLIKDRVNADTLREQERIRVEWERTKQEISVWRAEASTFNKQTALMAFRCMEDTDLNVMYVRGVIKNVSRATLGDVNVTAKFYGSGRYLLGTKKALIDDKYLARGGISTFYVGISGASPSRMKRCSISLTDRWKDGVSAITASEQESLSVNAYKMLVGSWVCNCEGNHTLHFFQDGTLLGLTGEAVPLTVGEYELVDENHIQLNRQKISAPLPNVYTNSGKESVTWKVSLIGDDLLTEFNGEVLRYRRKH